MIFPALVALAAAQTPFGMSPSSSNVRYDLVARGVDATTGASGLMVFNEPVSFANYWRANHRGAVPSLYPGFFNGWRLVAIHAGGRPGEGYGLGVTRIDRRIDRAVVSAIETVPPRRSRSRGGSPTSPWVLLRVERGAFDLVLQTRQVEGVPAYQTVRPGQVVQVGGATVIFGDPGYGGGYCPPR